MRADHKHPSKTKKFDNENYLQTTNQVEKDCYVTEIAGKACSFCKVLVSLEMYKSRGFICKRILPKLIY